jgi:UDP-N-acetylmuramoyl-tripeptide--D-alanyl-D-alanine ligase
METITIESLAKAIDGKVLKGNASEAINKVIIDSRQNGTDSVFFAIKGDNTDGHLYIEQALKNNAKAIVIHSDLDIDKTDAIIIKVKDTTQALLDLAGYYKSLFNIPVIAITGSCEKQPRKIL